MSDEEFISSEEVGDIAGGNECSAIDFFFFYGGFLASFFHPIRRSGASIDRIPFPPLHCNPRGRGTDDGRPQISLRSAETAAVKKFLLPSLATMEDPGPSAVL